MAVFEGLMFTCCALVLAAAGCAVAAIRDCVERKPKAKDTANYDDRVALLRGAAPAPASKND
jgi:hypothetical protein